MRFSSRYRRRLPGPGRRRHARCHSRLQGRLAGDVDAGDRAVHLGRLQFLSAGRPLAVQPQGHCGGGWRRGAGLPRELLGLHRLGRPLRQPRSHVRQREIAAQNGKSGIYTPQLVRNGQDWRDYSRALDGSQPARARITLEKSADDAFEAMVTPAEGVAAWAAYWTVTEHGHSSKVKAGENAGEFLQHDFVVRQYVPAGEYRGPSRLTLRAVPRQADHPRQVNLVVFDPKSGRPLQALSLGC